MLFKITNKANLTLLNQSTILFPNPARGHFPQPLTFLKKFQHLMPDDLVKKLPKFDKTKQNS